MALEALVCHCCQPMKDREERLANSMKVESAAKAQGLVEFLDCTWVRWKWTRLLFAVLFANKTRRAS